MPTPRTNPQLSILIVNYNGRGWLEKCLSSFRNLVDWTGSRPADWLEVVVVDNASTDDSRVMVEKNYPWVRWIQNEQNVGFSAGNNVGIQRTETPFYMLLNSDTEFLPDTDLRLLLEPFSQNPQLAVVTPKLVLDSGELDHASHRGIPTPWNSAMYFSGIAKKLPKVRFVSGYTQSWQDLNTAHFVEACSGAAMIVRRSASDDVGLLDESYFMYGEDLDWCYRFTLAGWKILFDPSVTIVHHKHKSGIGAVKSWETQERTISAFYDTMGQFFRKFYGQKYHPVTRLVLAKILDTMKTRKLQQERKRYARASSSEQG